MNLTRINAMGMTFDLAGDNTETKITCRNNGDTITVKHPIDNISQSWYDWQQKGQYIQVAFFYMNADEREFILSGITPEKWTALFGEDDEDEGENSGDNNGPAH